MFTEIAYSSPKAIVGRIPCVEKRRLSQRSSERPSERPSQQPSQRPIQRPSQRPSQRRPNQRRPNQRRPNQRHQYYSDFDTNPSTTVPPTTLSRECGNDILTILTYFLILVWETFSVLRSAYWIPFNAISQSPAHLFEFRNRGCSREKIKMGMMLGLEGEQQESWGQFVDIAG